MRQTLPYLFSLFGILFETLAIRCHLDATSLETLDDSGQEIAKGWKPNVMTGLGKVVKVRAFGVRSVGIEEISIAGAIIQDVYPVLRMSGKRREYRSLRRVRGFQLLAHESSIHHNVIEREEALPRQQPDSAIRGH